MTPDISPTLRELHQHRIVLAKEKDRRIKELELAVDEEATAIADPDHGYEIAYAEAYINTKGTVEERKCRAKLACVTKYQRMHVAIGLRRSATAALGALEKDYENLTAMINAYNRKLRVELELAGRAT